MAMVSSTTPRLGPRCPPVRLQVSTRKSRISLPSWSSWASERLRRSRGDAMDSRMPIAVECTGLEAQNCDCGLVQAAEPHPAVVLAHPRDHVVGRALDVE